MRRHPDPSAFQLALMEEPQPRREVRDSRCCLMLGPGERRRRARLVVFLEKAAQPILIVDACPEMGANGAGIAMAEAIVEALVVAVVEALLLQRPFEIPIGLGQEREVGMGLPRGCDRPWPERRRRQAPGALE